MKLRLNSGVQVSKQPHSTDCLLQPSIRGQITRIFVASSIFINKVGKQGLSWVHGPILRSGLLDVSAAVELQSLASMP